MRTSARRHVVRTLLICSAVLADGCTDEVVVSVPVSDVRVRPSEVRIDEGDSVQLEATVLGEDEELPPSLVRWTASDPTTASVNRFGMVRALSAGEASVTASFDGVSGSAVVSVTGASSLSIQPDSVAFFASEGGPDPAPIQAVVTAERGEAEELRASVTYAPDQSRGWLSAEMDSSGAPTSVTLSADRDRVEPGVYRAEVTVRSGAAAQAGAAVTVVFSVGGVTVRESGGDTRVTESGDTDTFDVALRSRPGESVFLRVVSADRGEVQASPTSLEFGPTSWDQPQRVTLTAVDDAAMDGDRTTDVRVEVEGNRSDDAYDDVPPHTVSVTTVDDDRAGLAVQESGGSTTVSESGSTDSFIVALTAAPSSNVVVRVTGDRLTEALVTSSALLTFTPQNWDSPRTVTVQGVDDLLPDGAQTSTVTLAVVADLSDPVYRGIYRPVSVTTVDNDDRAP